MISEQDLHALSLNDLVLLLHLACSELYRRLVGSANPPVVEHMESEEELDPGVPFPHGDNLIRKRSIRGQTLSHGIHPGLVCHQPPSPIRLNNRCLREWTRRCCTAFDTTGPSKCDAVFNFIWTTFSIKFVSQKAMIQCNRNVKVQAVTMNFGRSSLLTLTMDDSALEAVEFFLFLTTLIDMATFGRFQLGSCTYLQMTNAISNWGLTSRSWYRWCTRFDWPNPR